MNHWWFNKDIEVIATSKEIEKMIKKLGIKYTAKNFGVSISTIHKKIRNSESITSLTLEYSKRLSGKSGRPKNNNKVFFKAENGLERLLEIVSLIIPSSLDKFTNDYNLVNKLNDNELRKESQFKLKERIINSINFELNYISRDI